MHNSSPNLGEVRWASYSKLFSKMIIRGINE